MKRKLFALLTILVCLGACSSQESGQRQGRNFRGQRGGGSASGEGGETAISVKAHHVGQRPISTFIIANTTLESIRDVVVYSKLNAIVSELHVEEGDWVKQGQAVAQLDELEIRNEFDQAQIAVQQAQVAIGQAQVKAELSLANYDRARSLFEQQLTSQQEFDQAALTNRTDELALEGARQQLDAVNARLEAARIQLAYTTISSPLRGVVTQRLIDVGDRVNVNEQMLTVQEFPPLWARIYVPEKALSELQAGQQTQVAFEAYPDKDFTGRIKMISPTIDVASGTVKVTIEISKPEGLLRPGMFGTVHIATQTHADAIAVPKKAIVRERDLSYVFLVQPDETVVKREVQLGFSEENWVEIVDGVQAGDGVVTVGYETLNDGYLVKVAEWENVTGKTPRMAESQTTPAPPRTDGSASSSPAGASQNRQSQERPETRSQGDAARGPGASAGRRGGGRGRGQMLARLLENPEIQQQYEAKLAKDPSLADDPQKRRAFIREMMSKYGMDRRNR